MKHLAIILALLVLVTPAAAQQTRYYAPNGQSAGTSSPYGNGSRRYYDARGNTVGTSTTTSSGTTFYDARGNVTGRASK
jgi:YD repeat-containing protein